MLINQDEAQAFLDAIDDKRLKELLLHAGTEILLMEEGPQGEFDMLFFSMVVADFLSKNKCIQIVEHGDDDAVFL